MIVFFIFKGHIGGHVHFHMWKWDR